MKRFAASAAGCVFVALFAAAPAEARSAKAVRESAEVPTAYTSGQDLAPAKATVGTESDGPACSTARRRLWLESQGWVVRRVTVCP